MLKAKPKNFKFQVSVKILEQARWPEKEAQIEFSISELIPTGIHPVDYLRQRLSEEIRRHASQTSIVTKESITTSSEIAE